MDIEDKDLVNKSWKEMYIHCQANPLDNRTDKAFYTEYQVPPSTFEVWKRKNRNQIFQEVQRLRKQYVNEFRAKAFKSLSSKMDKDTNALKLAFQLMGDLVERTESSVEYRDHNDKIKRVQSLLSSINSRKATWDEANQEGVKSTVLGPEHGTPTGEEPSAPGGV